MTVPARHHYTLADYWAVERSSALKFEYLDGQIYAMTGSTPEHARLTASVMVQLGRHVRPPCNLFSSDLRLHCRATGLYTYADAALVCGKLERVAALDGLVAVTNPVLLVEMLSPSTEAYDRGDKFEHYKALESLRQYVLVSQRADVDVWTLRDGVWQKEVCRGPEIHLPSVDALLDSGELARSIEGL